MTLFEQYADTAAAVPPVKRPARWSLSNWSVRAKVLVIAIVPLVLAGIFGGLRVYDSAINARDLRIAADRAALLPAIDGYLAGLENVLVVHAAAGDIAAVTSNYDSARTTLTQQLDPADAVADVRQAVATLTDDGKKLVDATVADQLDLRQQVTGYAPLLLTAETAITGSVRVNDEWVRTEAEGLARAVGARGQMTMQRMLVERGGDLPDPELRAAMTALAGTEPSTVIPMTALLGAGSADADQLRTQMVTRLSLMSDPAQSLVGNEQLLSSIKTTDDIASRLIADTTQSITRTVDAEATDQRANAIRDGVLVLAAFLLVLGLVIWAARTLVGPLRRLRDGALKIAHHDLAAEIERVKAGDEREPAPLPIHTTEEVGQVAHAVDELHAQALLIAGDEARLRVMVNDMFETMSRRNKSLVDQQLSLIDRLERDEADPARLDSLFQLDHLATRMRRNGANLLVLAGAAAGRDKAAAVPLSELVDAAASEVQEYQRVQAAEVADCSVTGTAAADSVHLLAELLDNALQYSAPTEPVRVSAAYTPDGGVLIDVTDTGLGMTDGDLRIANTRLTAGGEVNPDSARHMGLFVVGRLAQRHKMRVTLRVSDGGTGITAQVYLPPELLWGAPQPEHSQHPVTAPLPQQWSAEPDYDRIAEQADDSDDSEAPVALLPRRQPGSSDMAATMGGNAFGAPGQPDAGSEPWWEHPAQPAQAAAPADTSGFFGSRRRIEAEPPEPVAQQDSDVDLIYQNMLSEWLVDPQELAITQDWKSVWDNGWAAAADAEDKPVHAHTESGLPLREPGARLVPGAPPTGADDTGGKVASDADSAESLDRDPDAIRTSMSNHFGGVHAARAQTRDEGQGHPQ